MLAMFIIVVGVGWVAVRLVTYQLPTASAPDQDRRLAEQAEHIESLEDELQRVNAVTPPNTTSPRPSPSMSPIDALATIASRELPFLSRPETDPVCS